MHSEAVLFYRSLAILFCLLIFVMLTGCNRASVTRTEKPQFKTPPLPDWNDSDADGMPDAIELTANADRTSFRSWFTYLAEMQFYQINPAWNDKQRDCAGLVRFAMREALRKHDRLWFQKMGAEYEAIAPDVKKFTLENSSLGGKLFRTDFGAFQASDLQANKFSEFADARTLKNHNAVFISRDRAQAQAGDLLFFEQAFAQKFPYHVMIFLGSARQANEGANDWVVYHTGAAPDEGGTLKKVRLSVLDQHPDKRWRPVQNNKKFLGFYRLKIIN